MNAPVDTKAIQAIDSAHFLHPFTDFKDLNSRGARVMTREDGAARRCADGAAGIELREAQTFGGHAIETRRSEMRLAVDTEIAVTEVVGKDDDDVGPGGIGSGAVDAEAENERRNQCENETHEAVLGHMRTLRQKRGPPQ